MFGSLACKVVMSTCSWYDKDERKRSTCRFWLEWWITFALALLSRLQHLSLHFLIKTSVSRRLRHLKSVSRMVSRSCQVDQQVKLLGKSRWKPWCAARLCVSRIQTQLLLFGSRGGGSLKTSSPINLAPPSSYVTFCHITEQPAPTNTLLPFCPRADLMYTQQVFKRKRNLEHIE